MANDQDFKTFVYDLVLPDFLCIQETWLVPQLQLIIPGYTSVRKDKKRVGGCTSVQAIWEVEKQVADWGFWFSVSKMCRKLSVSLVFLTNKTIARNMRLYLYMDRVDVIIFGIMI